VYGGDCRYGIKAAYSVTFAKTYFQQSMESLDKYTQHFDISTGFETEVNELPVSTVRTDDRIAAYEMYNADIDCMSLLQDYYWRIYEFFYFFNLFLANVDTVSTSLARSVRLAVQQMFPARHISNSVRQSVQQTYTDSLLSTSYLMMSPSKNVRLKSMCTNLYVDIAVDIMSTDQPHLVKWRRPVVAMST
jgi:hypothetical protein